MTEQIVTPPDPGQTPPPGGEPPKTFTQADLDRIIKERLTREQTRFADYDDLKKAAGELQKLKDAQLSESEKLTKRIAELEQVAADREAEAEATEAEVNKKLLHAEVRVLAATLNFIDPEEAWKLADLASATFGDDGKIDGVKKPLEKLAKDKPHLLKAVTAGGSPPNKPGKTAPKDSELEQAMADARQRFNIKDYSKQPTGGKE